MTQKRKLPTRGHKQLIREARNFCLENLNGEDYFYQLGMFVEFIDRLFGEEAGKTTTSRIR